MRIAPPLAVVLAIASASVMGQIRPVLAGEAERASAVSPAYVIGPGDILQISVWQEPQFGEVVEVRPDGKISLPLVSDVEVAGLTTDAAQRRLTDKLQGFVKHPLVSVVVTEVHSRIVYVIGEVLRPGPYPMVGPINVGQLIAGAGGATRKAKKKQVYVLRPGTYAKIPVNYQEILEGKRQGLAQNLQLKAGDTVVVP